MAATGTALLNFGAYPGSADASVAVTGQTDILTSSLIECWLMPVATTEHSTDEHVAMGQRLYVVASDIVAGTGFTIYGILDDGPGSDDVRGSQGSNIDNRGNAATVITIWSATAPNSSAGPMVKTPTQGVVKVRDPVLLDGNWTIAWAWK